MSISLESIIMSIYTFIVLNSALGIFGAVYGLYLFLNNMPYATVLVLTLAIMLFTLLLFFFLWVLCEKSKYSSTVNMIA
jgi:hypothetical protein